MKLRINNKTPIQKDFWGNGAIYHAYAGMPDDCGRVYTEEQCIEEARRIADMRLKIARTFYGWWAYDFDKGCWDWENEKMQIFYRWLSRMKEAGVTVAINTGWCCPGDINSSSWNGKSPFEVEGDWAASVQNYADWVSESVHQLVEVRGFTNVKILVMFTEPQNGNPKSVSEQSNIYDIWLEATTAAHNALVRDGRRQLVSIMGPNEGSTATSKMLKWVAQRAKGIVDIYASHNYQWLPATPKELIKTGKTAMAVMGEYQRAGRHITLKPNREYEATLDILFKKDMNGYGGGIVFGVFGGESEDGDIVKGGLLPSYVDGSTITIAPDDIPGEYTKYSVKFNSGEGGEALIGLYSGVKLPKELVGVCINYSKYKGMQPGTAYIDSFSVRDVETGEEIVENGDFSNEYDGWYHTSVAGGLTDPYYDWGTWVKTACDAIPGDDNDKPYCFDEYNVTYDKGYFRKSHGADLVGAAIALMNAGVRSSMVWTVFDQQWPNDHSNNPDNFVDGEHRHGVMPTLRQSNKPYSSYYAFTLLSRYIGGKGTKVYRGEGGNNTHTTMAVMPDGNVTIIISNVKSESEAFTIELEEALGKKLYRHSFDPEKVVLEERPTILPVDGEFEVGNTISDKIAPYGVIVYTTYDD